MIPASVGALWSDPSDAGIIFFASTPDQTILRAGSLHCLVCLTIVPRIVPFPSPRTLRLPLFTAPSLPFHRPFQPTVEATGALQGPAVSVCFSFVYRSIVSFRFFVLSISIRAVVVHMYPN